MSEKDLLREVIKAIKDSPANSVVCAEVYLPAALRDKLAEWERTQQDILREAAVKVLSNCELIDPIRGRYGVSYSAIYSLEAAVRAVAPKEK